MHGQPDRSACLLRLPKIYLLSSFRNHGLGACSLVLLLLCFFLGGCGSNLPLGPGSPSLHASGPGGHPSPACMALNQSGSDVNGACQCLPWSSGPAWLIMAAWRIWIPCVWLWDTTLPPRGSQTQTVSCFVPWSFYRELPESAGWSGLHLPLLTLIVVVQSLRMAITWPIPGALLLKARHGASALRLVSGRSSACVQVPFCRLLRLGMTCPGVHILLPLGPQMSLKSVLCYSTVKFLRRFALV